MVCSWTPSNAFISAGMVEVGRRCSHLSITSIKHMSFWPSFSAEIFLTSSKLKPSLRANLRQSLRSCNAPKQSARSGEKEIEQERETETETETERDREREREKRERERGRETDRQTERQTERETYRQRERQTDKQRQRQRHRKRQRVRPDHWLTSNHYQHHVNCGHYWEPKCFSWGFLSTNCTQQPANKLILLHRQ